MCDEDLYSLFFEEFPVRISKLLLGTGVLWLPIRKKLLDYFPGDTAEALVEMIDMNLPIDPGEDEFIEMILETLSAKDEQTLIKFKDKILAKNELLIWPMKFDSAYLKREFDFVVKVALEWQNLPDE